MFVDDGSTDGSLVRPLAARTTSMPNVVVVHLRRNFGKAAALQAGLSRGARRVRRHDRRRSPGRSRRRSRSCSRSSTRASTSYPDGRRGATTRFLRRLFSRVFNWATGAVSGVHLHDVNCGLKAYRAEVLRGMRIYGELHRFIPVLAAYRGFRVAEIPVNHRARQHGRSRYGPERYLRGFFDLLSVTFMGRYRHRPLHLFGGIGVLMGAVGFIILLYLTMLKLWGRGHRYAPAPDTRRVAVGGGYPVRVARPHLGARHVAARRANRRAPTHRPDGRRGAPLTVGSAARGTDFIGPSGNSTNKYETRNPVARGFVDRFLREFRSRSGRSGAVVDSRRRLRRRRRHGANGKRTGASTVGVDLGSSGLRAEWERRQREHLSFRSAPPTTSPSRTIRSTASARSRSSSTSNDRATHSPSSSALHGAPSS